MTSHYLKTWIKIAKKNLWLEKLNLTEKSFVRFATLAEMASRMAAGSWSIGTAFYCGDICAIQQVHQHGEWLIIKGQTSFESFTVREPWEKLAGMTLPKLRLELYRIDRATEEQCRTLTY